MSPAMSLTEKDDSPQPRGNALRHGLSGAGVVLPENLRLAVDRRRISYARVFPPVNQLDLDDIDAAALGWCRFLECRSEMTYRASLRADMAVGKWGLLRLIDAQERAKRLGHNPPSVVANLKASFGGVLWLLDQWRMLKDALEMSKEGTWTVKQIERANNLAGVDRIFRENDPHRIGNGSTDDRKKLVEVQVAELKGLLADGELERLDEVQRQATLRGDHALQDSTYDRLRLYEQRAFRMYEKAIGRLRERHPEALAGKVGVRGQAGREAMEAFGAEVDRGIVGAEDCSGVESVSVIETAPDDGDFLADQEAEDLRSAYEARLASDEVQGRVTDEEMALLDGEARSYLLALAGRLGLKLDAETAMRGLIGSTRIQAEEMGEEDPNGKLFADLRAKADAERADRERREVERDRMRKQRKAIKAARRRNRGR
ncbi:MAG: hypothetical protein U0800_27855 [Isosphaeraceae bacterium]